MADNLIEDIGVGSVNDSDDSGDENFAEFSNLIYGAFDDNIREPENVNSSTAENALFEIFKYAPPNPAMFKKHNEKSSDDSSSSSDDDSSESDDDSNDKSSSYNDKSTEENNTSSSTGGSFNVLDDITAAE